MAKNKEPEKKMVCACPYCEEEMVLSASPFCQSCLVRLRYCLKCDIVVEKDAKVCPKCGQPLTREAP